VSRVGAPCTWARMMILTDTSITGTLFWTVQSEIECRRVAVASDLVVGRIPRLEGKMSNIRALVANVEVDDLEAALRLYQSLAGEEAVRRFSYQDLELALVGPFLLISGAIEKHVSQVATVVVESLDPVLKALDAAGAEILEGPDQTSNGTRFVVRHPDGAVFEYMQPTASAA
jgi:predicted enzyme related to lactoylglutathione lyase